MNENRCQFKVWHRGNRDWAWEAREVSEFGSPRRFIGAGSMRNRQLAREAAQEAIAVHRLRESTRWVDA